MLKVNRVLLMVSYQILWAPLNLQLSQCFLTSVWIPKVCNKCCVDCLHCKRPATKQFSKPSSLSVFLSTLRKFLQHTIIFNALRYYTHQLFDVAEQHNDEQQCLVCIAAITFQLFSNIAKTLYKCFLYLTSAIQKVKKVLSNTAKSTSIIVFKNVKCLQTTINGGSVDTFGSLRQTVNHY